MGADTQGKLYVLLFFNKKIRSRYGCNPSVRWPQYILWIPLKNSGSILILISAYNLTFRLVVSWRKNPVGQGECLITSLVFTNRRSLRDLIRCIHGDSVNNFFKMHQLVIIDNSFNYNYFIEVINFTSSSFQHYFYFVDCQW